MTPYVRVQAVQFGEDDMVSHLMEEARKKAEDNVVSTFRASISNGTRLATEESTELKCRIAKCAADTERLLNEANDFLMQPHRTPTPAPMLRANSGGVRLQVARTIVDRARTDSEQVQRRVERLLEIRMGKDGSMLGSPRDNLTKSAGTPSPKSTRRNGLVIDDTEKEAFMGLMTCSDGVQMEQSVER